MLVMCHCSKISEADKKSKVVYTLRFRASIPKLHHLLWASSMVGIGTYVESKEQRDKGKEWNPESSLTS